MTTVPTMNALLDQLSAAGVPALDPGDQRLALTLLRELALGEPVGTGKLARAAHLPETEAAAALKRIPMVVRDDQQQVVGFNGLAVHEMGEHRLHLEGRTLFAWCAWDTLFLPELLDIHSARVTSRSPASGAEIALTVTDTGPTAVEPEDTVVSLLLPKGDVSSDVIQRFCHFVHFFSSRQDGEQWVSEHPGTFLISLDKVFSLGRLVNHARFGGALAQ
jgi:alkylmercury lyase